MGRIRGLLLSLLSAYACFSVSANSISSCPPLPPRRSPATSVNDLRPDDIKVVAALGDSITAGFGAKGIQDGTIINLNNLAEDRGISFAAGGDDGAITIPNFLKHYNPNLIGASLGQHFVELCWGLLCPPFQYHPTQDQLNAAQSGGEGPDLNHELDYLIYQMKNRDGIDFQNDWKMINLLIGSNDMCDSCVDPLGLLTPFSYKLNVRSVVERIRQEIPRVVVNLMGTFKVSDVFFVTANQSYCNPFKGLAFEFNTLECPCWETSQGRTEMDQTSDGYNLALSQIYDEFKGSQKEFAVIYQPTDVNLDSFPITGFSNIDCFHPSQITHEWIAKSLWQSLFLKQDQKKGAISPIFNSSLPVYCPSASDRIQTL